MTPNLPKLLDERKQKREATKDDADYKYVHWRDCEARTGAQVDEACEKLIEVLKFYAGDGCDNREDFYKNRIFQDKGQAARAILRSHGITDA